jgi:hypothetical protein
MGQIEVRSAAPRGAPSTIVSVPAGGADATGWRARSHRAAGRSVNLAAAVLAILASASVSVVLAATSDHVERPTATALYYGSLVATSLLAALFWFLRRPGSTFGLLLALFGVCVWVVSWTSSDWALAAFLRAVGAADAGDRRGGRLSGCRLSRFGAATRASCLTHLPRASERYPGGGGTWRLGTRNTSPMTNPMAPTTIRIVPTV